MEPMKLLRIDLVSMFDLEFEKPIDQKMLAHLEQATVPENRHAQLYTESFEWLFNGETLPGFRRFIFNPPKDSTAAAFSLLLHAKRAAGVFSVFQTFDADTDPIKVKHGAWDESDQWLSVLEQYGLDPKDDTGRLYPLLVLMADTTDLQSFSATYARELGRIFTGDYESEDSRTLEGYIKQNLSGRTYEHLLLRWTEGLAIYSAVDQKKYELTFMRATQLFETCIMIQRILGNLSDDVDTLSRRLTFPRPWKTNGLLQSLAQMETDFLYDPPVQSVEAERLLREAYERFGIPKIFEATRRKGEFLEQRFQWAKAQFLGFVAVLIYLADKLHMFDVLANRLGLNAK